MQPSEFEEIDWDEGLDLAERVEKRYAEDLEAVLEVFKVMLENNAISISNTMVEVMGSMGSSSGGSRW